MRTETNCKVCKKGFISWNPKPTFCSLVCKASFQRYPIDGDNVTKLYLSGMTKEEVARELNSTKKVIENTMKRLGVNARKAVKRDQWGEKNHQWKGNGASIGKLHSRLYRRFGTPKFCSVCGTTDLSKTYDWANLTGNYGDIGDFKRMCRSCHWRFDKKIFNIKKMKQYELLKSV